MNIELIKKIVMIFLVCTAGAVVLQFAFPILLGVLVNGLPFAGVFVIYDLLIRKKLRGHLSWNSEAGEGLQENPEETREERTEKDGTVKSPQRSNVQEEDKEQDKAAFGAVDLEEKRLQVLQWYQERGGERLKTIIATQYARGLYECWIRKDGICNIRTEKGFRRAGSLPGYPGECTELLAEVMRQDGLNAVVQKQYLYLSWAEE